MAFGENTMLGNIEQEGSSKKEWLGQEIRPISLEEMDRILKKDLDRVLGYSDSTYRTNRGVNELLDKDSHDYAKLPPLGKESAMEVFVSMPKGGEWLDVGCGTGDFIEEVLLEVNGGLNATGFDARTWENEKEIPEIVLGDIHNINENTFKKHPDGFDLITSGSVFYHLTDYWGAFQRISNLLKQDGKVIVSTVCRPRYNSNPINDERGEFLQDPKVHEALYYRNRNLFDVDGNLMSMADALRVINANNEGFQIEYHSGVSKNAHQSGELNYGGGLSARRVEKANPLNLKNIFYCYYPDQKFNPGSGFYDVSFIVAKSDEEIDRLRKEGYVSVQDRL